MMYEDRSGSYEDEETDSPEWYRTTPPDDSEDDYFDPEEDFHSFDWSVYRTDDTW